MYSIINVLPFLSVIFKGVGAYEKKTDEGN